VARVGGQGITTDAIGRIAGAQQVDAASACDIAVRDTVLALGAERAGLGDAPLVEAETRATLARRLLRQILEEARAEPATSSELATARARHWLEVDRPEGFRTIHAVVRFDPADEQARARGLAVAESIRSAAAPVSERAPTLSLPDGAPPSGPRTSPADDPDPLSSAFRAAVAAVPSDGLEVRVEVLPPVAASGRVLELAEQHLEEAFARAAAALPGRGALSPVVTSPAGAHVILLLERMPPSELTPEARLGRLRDFVAYDRAVTREKRLLADLRGPRGLASVEPGADALLSLVDVGP
jgi:peptidyl-prolyl cis-trans isomerase C